MKKINLILIITISVFLLGALPASSDYNKLTPTINLGDPIAIALQEPNSIVCVISKISPQLNVNKGSYLSKVNIDSCFNGQESPDDIWIDIYTNVKNVSQNKNDGYIVNFWFTIKKPNSDSNAFVRAVITSPPTEENINGNIHLNYCITNNLLGSDCAEKGVFKSSGNNLEIYQAQKDTTDGSLGQINILSAKVNKESSFGSFYQYRIQNSDNGSSIGNFEQEGQYTQSDNKALINVTKSITCRDINDLTTCAQAFLTVGNKCVSTKNSDSVKEIYEYNLYDNNGKLVNLSRPGFVYFIVDENGDNVKNGSNGISGRMMSSGYLNGAYRNLYNNYISPADELFIANYLINNPAKKIYAKASTSTNQQLYNISLNSNNTSFNVLDSAGNPYIVSEGIPFSVNQNSTQFATVPDLSNLSPQATSKLPLLEFEYQGSGYIWTDSAQFTFKDGAQISSNGNTYFIRPSFYKTTPLLYADITNQQDLTSSPCNNLSLSQANVYKTNVDAIFSSMFVSNGNKFNSLGTKSSLWSDPRPIIGSRPTLSSSKYKYINGVAQ